MALTTAQRPPGRDQSRSQQIRHTQQLSHTRFFFPTVWRPDSAWTEGRDPFHVSQTGKADFLVWSREVWAVVRPRASGICPFIVLTSLTSAANVFGKKGADIRRNSHIDTSRSYCTRRLKELSSCHTRLYGTCSKQWSRQQDSAITQSFLIVLFEPSKQNPPPDGSLQQEPRATREDVLAKLPFLCRLNKFEDLKQRVFRAYFSVVVFSSLLK